MKAQTAIALFAAATFACAPVFAKGSGGSRTNYGGGSHSKSHDGHYNGGSGSSHKGGTYANPKGGNEYGKHKK